MLLIGGIFFLAPPQAQGADCLSPELEQEFPFQRDMGGIPIYAADAVEVNRVDHIEHLLTGMLAKDDGMDGRIRQSLIDSRMAYFILWGEDDSEDIDQQMLKSGGCLPVPILAIEVHFPGSAAADIGMVDESFADVAEHIYFYGIKPTHPDWDQRLNQARKDAVSNGRFVPEKAEDPEPEDMWDALYLTIGLEVYYGLWQSEEFAREGEVSTVTREQLRQNDPALVQLIEELFPPQL